MRAVRVAAYGGPENIRIKEETEPVPQENELLIRVEAAVVTPPDCAFRAGKPAAVRIFTGVKRPKRHARIWVILNAVWCPCRVYGDSCRFSMRLYPR